MNKTKLSLRPNLEEKKKNIQNFRSMEKTIP